MQRYDKPRQKDLYQGLENILDKKDNEFIDAIKGYAKELKNTGVATHQLRSIFSKVVSAREAKDIYPLRYKLAYVAGREKKLYLFCEEMDKLIKKVTNKNLSKFKEFFEGIIAYHKYYGGK